MKPDGYAACASIESLLDATKTLVLCEHDHMFTVRQDRWWLDNLSDLALECIKKAHPDSPHIVVGHPE